MKKVISMFYVIAFLYCYSATSQQLVQNISDIHKLKDNEAVFINKPLKDLLKEIKPEIKTATVLNEEGCFLFCFRFTTIEQQRKREGAISDRVSLFVEVNQFIPWNWKERPKGSELNWTVNDVQKFGNYTVVRIGVVATSQK